MPESGESWSVEEEVVDRFYLSMRAKVTMVTVGFLSCMVFISIWGMPVFVSGLARIWTQEESLDSPMVFGLGLVKQVKLGPMGRYMATCGESGIHIWSLNGTLISALYAKEGIPWNSIDFSPNGEMLAVADHFGQILVVNVPYLTEVGEIFHDYGGFDSNPDPVPLRWSPNSSLLAFVYEWQNRTYIFDVENLSLRRVFDYYATGHGPYIRGTSLDWSPDGSQLLRTGYNSTLIFDTFTGSVVQHLGKRDVRDYDLAAFSPSGRMVAIINGNITVSEREVGFYLEIYDIESGALLTSSGPHEWWLASVAGLMAWSSDEKYVAVCVKDRILFYRAEDGELLHNASAHKDRIISFSWVGDKFASASMDQTVKVWRLIETPQGPVMVPLRSYMGWLTDIIGVSWYPDSQKILTTGDYPVPLKVYSIHDGTQELYLEGIHGMGRTRAALSPDGKMIATLIEGEIQIWDAVFGTLANRITINYAGTFCEWNPAKPGVLAVAGRDGVRVWDVLNPENGVLVELAKGGDIRCMAWSPTGDLLAIGWHIFSEDLVESRVEIWDPSRSTILASEKTWTNLHSLAWSPDNEMLACLEGRFQDKESYFGEVYPSDPSALTNWRIIGDADYLELELHDRKCLPRDISYRDALTWAPNSTMIALATGYLLTGDPRRFPGPTYCGMAEPGVMIWGMNKTHLIPIMNMTGPIRPVNAVAWSPDGSMIAAGSMDGTLRVWIVGPPQDPQDPHIIGTPVVYFIGIVTLAITIDIFKTLHKK